jgi:hypothetical protein
MLQIEVINPSSANVNLTTLHLKAVGSGNDLTGISDVSLYLDLNGDGAVDAGDSLLANGTFPLDNGTLTLSFNQDLPPSGNVNLLVAYNFTTSAMTGTYQVQLVDNTALAGINLDTGVAFLASGAPINGAVIRVVAATPTQTATDTATLPPPATATPTWTGTSTPLPPATATITNTFTRTRTPTPIPSATPTPTITNTGTPTPVPTVTPTPTITSTGTWTPVLISDVMAPYPNPSDGDQIQVTLHVAGISRVQWSVFTLNFRKIVGGEVSINQYGTVAWDLKDQNGTPASNGLYYLRIEVIGAQPTVKIFKIMIMR